MAAGRRAAGGRGLRGGGATSTAAGLILAALAAGCAADPPPDPRPVPPGSFAFAALGDAPYVRADEVRFERLVEQLNRVELAWVLHVGDILWFPCSEEKYRQRLATFESIRHPFLLTPGDNDWSDCWEPIAGGHRPLDRLAELRRIFFPSPATAGEAALGVERQSLDPRFGEFPENGSWLYGGVVFATVHLVGSRNAGMPFPGRSEADDREVERRTAAALAWTRAAFAAAAAEDAAAVVLAIHAEPGFHQPAGSPHRAAFEPWLALLAEESERWGRPVLLVHGDDHRFLVDRPLEHPDGRPVPNLTRLEVPGAPDIGWVRVVVEPSAAEPFRFEPYLMRRPWLDLVRW